MNKLINNILNLIYPSTCGFCGKICKEYLCKKCEIQIKKYEINLIQRNKKCYFDEVFSIFKYEEVIRDMIIKYKFQNKPYLYKTFLKIILNNKKVCGFLKKYDIIIPVPIHRIKKQKRGYNQTELIAREISKKSNLEIGLDILVKKINTRSQSESTKRERKRNIKDAFKVQNVQKIKDKSILIFDDIYTTGSTVNECAEVLKEVGIKRIGVLTVAKDYKK